MKECEFCARYIRHHIEVFVNGREYHSRCFDALTPEQREAEVEMAMALPNPNLPDYDAKMDLVHAYAFEHKLGLYGDGELTPAIVRAVLANR